MPIENINLLQHGADLEGLMRSNDYYIQALANLGQRTGIKGDSIKYTHFLFKDALTNKDVDASKYIGYIKKTSDDEIQLGVTEYTNIIFDANNNTAVTGEYISRIQNISDKYIIKNNTSFTVNVNNIESILPVGSILYVYDDYFISDLRCKILGTDNDDNNNVEWQWTKINLETGQLDSAIRAFNLVDDYYIMLVIEHDKQRSDINNKKYTLKCYIMTTDSIKTANDDLDLEQIRNFKNYFKINHDNSPYINTNKTYNSVQEIDDDDNNIFNMFIKYREYEVIDNYTIYLTCDTLKNTQLAIDEESILSQEFYNIDELLKQDIMGLYHRITAINDDLTLTFPNLLNYWTSNQFIKNRTVFVERILIKLFERLLQYTSNTNRTPIMFIPLDYKFNYICDNSNMLNLYYTDDLYVSLLNLLQFKSTITNKQNIALQEFLQSTNNIIFDYEYEDKIKLFNIVMEHNQIYSEYINNISVHERYTLPFVNAENNWQINDVNTKIRAVGKNAGKPNIIFVDSTDENNVNVVFGANMLELESCKWIRHEEYNNAYLPEITDKNIDLFDDALLLNIVNYDNETHTLLFALDETGKFNVIMSGDSVVDITKLLSLKYEIKTIINDNKLANKNRFNFIIFDNNDNTVDHDTTNVLNNCFYFGESEHNDKNSTEIKICSPQITDPNNDYLIESGEVKHIIPNKYIDTHNSTKTIYSPYKQYECVETEQVITHDILTRCETQTQLETEIKNKYQDDAIYVELVTDFTEIHSSENETETVAYKYWKETTNYKEYLPIIPTVKLADVLLRDVNILNRNNIISVANDGDLYYAYIGTDHHNDDKSILHFGTSNENVNLSTDTMVNVSSIDNAMKKHDTLSIDFDNMIFENKTLQSNIQPTIKHDVPVDDDNVSIYTYDLNVIGKVLTKKCLQSTDAYYIPKHTFNSENNEVVENDLKEYMFIRYAIYRNQQATGEYLYFVNLYKLLLDYCNIDITQEQNPDISFKQYFNLNSDSFKLSLQFDGGFEYKLYYIGKELFTNTINNNIIANMLTLNAMRYIFSGTLHMTILDKNKLNGVNINVCDTVNDNDYTYNAPGVPNPDDDPGDDIVGDDVDDNTNDNNSIFDDALANTDNP